MSWRRITLGLSVVVLTLIGFNAAQAQSPTPVETAIELAWLADPITFPYSLRAYNKDGAIAMHGKVPSPMVRKQALNIARLHANTIVDRTDMVPGCEKAFTALPKEKIIQLLKAGIGRGLPQMAATVAVQCDDDGRVTLTGTATSLVEKMSLNDIVRSSPGCVLAYNKVCVGNPVVQPSVIRPASYTVPPLPPAPKVAAPPPVAARKPVTNEQTEIMREKLVKLCPGATSFYVLNTGPKRYQIQFIARTDEEATRLATLIFDQPEWKHLRLDIGAHVPR